MERKLRNQNTQNQKTKIWDEQNKNTIVPHCEVLDFLRKSAKEEDT